GASPTDLIAVGASETGKSGPFHAFKFSLAANLTTDLGALGGPAATSLAFGISDEASTVVGASFLGADTSGPQHAFRIGSDDVMVDLGSLAGAVGNSVAFATNGDGSVVVGKSDIPGGGEHAFRWTVAPGGNTGSMTDLGGNGSVATAVNLDG